MSEFKVGDRVRVKMAAKVCAGRVGTFERIVRNNSFSVLLDGDECTTYLLDTDIELLHRPEQAEQSAPSPVKHSHYFRPCPYDSIDVYRVLSIFSVADPCLQHAVKKLLVAGGRGHKDISRDVQDAIDTLVRWQAMRDEEAA